SRADGAGADRSARRSTQPPVGPRAHQARLRRQTRARRGRGGLLADPPQRARPGAADPLRLFASSPRRAPQDVVVGAGVAISLEMCESVPGATSQISADEADAMIFEALLDRAFGHPQGVLGRLGGWLMARGNRRFARQVIAGFGLRADASVLEIG